LLLLCTRMHKHHSCDHPFEVTDDIKNYLAKIHDTLPPEIQGLSLEERAQFIIEQTRKRRIEQHNHSQDLRRIYLEMIAKEYKPLYPHLRRLEGWELDEELAKAVGPEGSRQAIMQILTKVGQGLYTFKMLSDKSCREFIEEVEYFEKWCKVMNLAPQRPNSMNNYGAMLDDFGFEIVLDELVSKIVNPLSKIVYPYLLHLDSHHGFIVEYQMGKDVKLNFHVDDSEVTLNVCLGKQFEKGELYFGGVRCQYHQQTAASAQEHKYVSHQPGIGLLHVGKHRHAAQKITSGHRLNLILWCRSAEFREKEDEECPDWCDYDQPVVSPHGPNC